MLVVPDQIRAAVLAHADFCRPEEACGLLAVDGSGALRMAYSLTNVERSASRFTVDPDEHFRALLHAERHGWEVAGSFHSHPSSAAVPSRTDVAASLSPDWVHLIAGVGPGGPELRAWKVSHGLAVELPIGDARSVA